MTQDRFADKVAIVTGGSSGIGRATVDRLHAEGAKVIAVDVQDPVGEPFAEGIELERMDITDEQGWDRLVSSAIERHGHIDTLICVAGTTNDEPLLEESLEGWQRVVDVNQTAIFLAMRAVVPKMIENGGGSIVNVASHFASIAVPLMVSYHASKGAVLSLSRNVAVTYAQQGIRVNTVQPGPTETPLLRKSGDEVVDAVVASVPLQRLADPSELAAAITFLASDEASYIAGTTLLVDGGYTAV